MSAHAGAVSTQVAVIGGGLTGVSAAIAAARLGARTTLIQDRPVLGGNSSSEIRMHICGGASGHHRFGRETGIIEELRLENAYRNPFDRPPLWDWLLWESVRREPALTLWLNTRAGEQVELSADGAITHVLCRQAHTEKSFWLQADLFIDCSGDGEVAMRAGAEFRMGREARSEFGEESAPEKPDHAVLASSLMFEARDVGRPVPFHPPSWAKDFPGDQDLPFRHHALPRLAQGTGLGKGFWWIEFGGWQDTIGEDEAIRDELVAILFGVWDHLKNHGDHGMENWVLDWIGAVPGKRESRRFLGDYILCQRDIEKQTLFPDRIAYGGWPIDLHPPEGIFSPEPPCDQRQAADFYSIPLRSLYSKNVPNLLFAGRNLSASHVALGSTRVMGTCALVGQAAGTAAAMAVARGLRPREFAEHHVHHLQQQLLRDDCYIIGLRREDPGDLAPKSHITASSVRALEERTGEERVPVPPAVVQGFVASESRIAQAAVFLLSSSGSPARARLRLYRSQSLKHFRPEELLAEAEVLAPAGEPGWVTAQLDAPLQPGSFYFLELEPRDPLFWFASAEELPGTQTARWQETGERWQRRRGTFRFQLSPVHRLYRPDWVVSGIARPEEEPNLWLSEAGLPQWLEFEFGEPTLLSEVTFLFDTDLGQQFISTTPATCVKGYRLDRWASSHWQPVLEERENHQRLRRHRFSPVTSHRYRLTVLETWGAPPGRPEARIYEVRLYGTPVG